MAADKGNERKESKETTNTVPPAVKDAVKNAEVKDTPKDTGNREKVGDILRKERLTRRITIETIAKDLKLNIGYVKALEASDYDSLPPDPYVRVYIRSLTKYLSLDAEVILKEFYKERGLIADDSVQNPAGKIDMTIQRQDKNPVVIIIAALIVVLAVFAFIANKKGWISQPDTASSAIEEKPDSNTSTIIDHDAISKKIADSILDATIAGQRQESETPLPPTPATRAKTAGGINMGRSATTPTPVPPPPRP